MTADRKRPTEPPPSAGVLARYAQGLRARARRRRRPRSRVGCLHDHGGCPRACHRCSWPTVQRQGRGCARTASARPSPRTKDIDIVLRDTKADLAEALEQALTGDAYQGFSFRRKGEPLLLDNGAVNMKFAVTYRGQPWTSISVDIARAEAGESEVEWVEAIALTDAFGVTGPAQLPCLPLRFHVAQKLHGVTLPPRPGKQNERFRDLVDLLLMETLVSHDFAVIREACELVFRSRNTHTWPPHLDAMPSHWAAPFARLAGTSAPRNRCRDRADPRAQFRRTHPHRIVVADHAAAFPRRMLMAHRASASDAVSNSNSSPGHTLGQHHLGISECEVEAHLTTPFARMGAASRTDAVAAAIRRGWLTPDDQMQEERVLARTRI